MPTPRDEAPPKRDKPASNPLRKVSLGSAVLSSVAIPLLTGSPAHAAAPAGPDRPAPGVVPPRGAAVPQNRGIQYEDDAPAAPLAVSHPVQAAKAAPPAQYRVVRGDTLYGIAADLLGDGARYPDIFHANQGRVESDGARFTDPDLIMPDWVLDIPAAGSGHGKSSGKSSGKASGVRHEDRFHASGPHQQTAQPPVQQNGDQGGDQGEDQGGNDSGAKVADAGGTQPGGTAAQQDPGGDQNPDQNPDQSKDQQGDNGDQGGYRQGTDPSVQDTTAPAPQDSGQSSDMSDADWQSQDLDTWIDRARGVLAANGVQVSHDAIHTTAIHESSGDPSAINLYDGNAAAGHPSIGLLQTIQPTFDAYALDGYRDIYNPIDNIIAAVRYATATYGSMEDMVAGQCGGDCWHGY